MSDVEIGPEEEPLSRLDKTKKLVKENWKPLVIGVVIGGATTIIVARPIFMRYMAATSTGVYIKKAFIKDSVFLIETCARQQGAPSYMIRCVEGPLVGGIWNSQLDFARAVKVSPQYVSKQLKGGSGYVRGNHLTRVAVGVPGTHC